MPSSAAGELKTAVDKTKNRTDRPGRFVPYEIKLANGNLKKFNLAVRKDNRAGRRQTSFGVITIIAL